MQYLSLDIETTGTDPEIDQILEFGCVAVDTNEHPSTWKTMHVIIAHDRIEGSPVAIAMNERIFKFLSQLETDPENLEEDWSWITPELLHPILFNFLETTNFEKNKNGEYSLNIAGKNAAGFDIPFLKEHFRKFNNINIEDHREQVFHFKKRVIDPAILYTDFIKDTKLPDMKLCKSRAGLNTDVRHLALKDAWDVVLLVCNKHGYDLSKMITEEYLDDHFIIDERISREWSHVWAIAPNVFIRKEEECDSPFRQFKVISIFGGLELYIWSLNELDSIINNNVC